jgi:antitoxin YqcF
MPVVTSQQRRLAEHTALAMRVEKPPVHRFWDENKESSVFILEATDRPQDGVASYATIGLSDRPLMFKRREFDTRVELVDACGSAFSGFANVLATAAFCVINSGWFCAPGNHLSRHCFDVQGFSDIERYLLLLTHSSGTRRSSPP